MTLFERIYFLGYSIKKRRTLKKQKKLPHNVISIGNMTFGGTGKTPATISVALEARKRRFSPCVLTRGYKGEATETCLLSTGEGPIMDVTQAGDEAFLMATKIKDIPIVKGKNRYEAGMLALESPDLQQKPDLFILDDGFQHWAVARDKDVVLIDSTDPLQGQSLPPFGRLREPVSEIRRADILLITRSDECEPRSLKKIQKELGIYNEKAPVFLARHRPLGFRKHDGGLLPASWAKGRKIFAFCGIGNPLSFTNILQSLQANIVGVKNFRDHHRFSEGDIGDITAEAKKSGADWIVTTEKDIMKLSELDVPENLLALSIEFDVDEEFFEEVFTF